MIARIIFLIMFLMIVGSLVTVSVVLGNKINDFCIENGYDKGVDSLNGMFCLKQEIRNDSIIMTKVEIVMYEGEVYWLEEKE